MTDRLKKSEAGVITRSLKPSALRSIPPVDRTSVTSIRTTLAAFALVSLPALSGCVGSTVNETLESAALNSPVQIMEDVAEPQVDYMGLAAIPVPVRAPRTGALALTGEDVTPAEAATGDLLELANAEPDDSLLESQDDVAGSGTQIAALDADKTKAAASSTTAGQQTLSPSPQTRAQPVTTRQPATTPPKPQTLFGALFGAKSKPKAAAQKTLRPAATVQTARATTTGNALPGVKRDSALFGIGDEDGGTRGELIPQDSVRVASVGSFGRFKTVNGLVLQTDRVQVDCFKPELMRILRIVERRYGKKVMVTSGFRSASANRRAGGARNSTHIYCKAADIQVDGVSKWDLAKFLRTVDGRGGVGTYCRTKSVHIDVGSVRDWHHPCRRGKSRVKKKRT